jgi:3-methyladenine DNA glycosylase AlkD
MLKITNLIQEKLEELGTEERAKFQKKLSFCSVNKEEMQFFGVTVPNIRLIAREFCFQVEFVEILSLLQSHFHENRLLALEMLSFQFKSPFLHLKWQIGKPETSKINQKRQEIVDFYLQNLQYLNSWDLVDISAYKILGEYLLLFPEKEDILDKLAKTNHLWSQRVSIVATLTLIRKNKFSQALRLAEIFLFHPHDLMHKATGWCLREIGKKDELILKKFLDKNASKMPRTMLRYSIERFDTETRKRYLEMK